MCMRGSAVSAACTGAPSRPIRSTSPSLTARASAWYCMRGLRPRSPSTITAVRMTVYLSLLAGRCRPGLLLTPLVTSASAALGLVDAPGGRKVHSRPCRAWAAWRWSSPPARLAGARLLGSFDGQTAVTARHRLAPILARRGPDLRRRPRSTMCGRFRLARSWPSRCWRRRRRDGVGPADRAHHASPAQTWQLGWLAWPVTLALAGRPHQRVQPDRRHRRPGGRHRRHRRRGLRRDPDRPRPVRRSDAARRVRRRGARLPGLQLRAGLDLPRRRRQPGRRVRAGGDRHHRLAEGRDRAGRRRAAADLRAADRRRGERR